MQKKILIFTLCFTIIFSSLNIKKSYANPLLGKVAEVSIIYSIGRLAFDTAGFVGTIADIIDLGGSIYSKMTDAEKDNYKNSVSFEDDKFTYSDNSYNYISDYVPENNGYHLMTNVKKSFIPEVYIDDYNHTFVTIKDVFDDNKQIINIQGYNYDILLQRKKYGSQYRYTLWYKPTSSTFSYLNNKELTVPTDYIISLSMYVSSINNGLGTLTMEVNYTNSKGTFTWGKFDIATDVPSTCSNCPHDISLKPTYKYPTSSELEEIEKNYPQYENDIVVPGDVSNGGGSNGGGSNGGGSNVNNSPIITNPPSFPNLEEFDFSGLQLDPLTNLFSNFKNKFPFSLPFDLANLIDGLTQDPLPPIFEVDLFGESMILDLTQFTDLANILKAFTILGYLVSLILLTKRFGG